MQITPGTGVYGKQGSVGGVVLQKVDASLPLVTAGAGGAGGAATPRRLVLKRQLAARRRPRAGDDHRAPALEALLGHVTLHGHGGRAHDALDGARAELVQDQQVVRLRVRAARGFASARSSTATRR